MAHLIQYLVSYNDQADLQPEYAPYSNRFSKKYRKFYLTTKDLSNP